MEEYSVNIIGLKEYNSRDFSWDESPRFQKGKISAETLRKNIQSFTATIMKSLEDVNSAIGSFELDTVELTAQMSMSGELSIMGAVGTELSSANGIKFVFKRNK